MYHSIIRSKSSNYELQYNRTTEIICYSADRTGRKVKKRLKKIITEAVPASARTETFFFLPRTRSGFILARKCVTPALSHSHCRTGHTQFSICTHHMNYTQMKFIFDKRTTKNPRHILFIQHRLWSSCSLLSTSTRQDFFFF